MHWPRSATRLVVQFLFLLAIGASNVLAQSPEHSTVKPNVSDTGYEIIHMILTPSLYWVDNNRLLFAGIKTVDMQAAIAAKELDRVARLKKLYLWDGASKSVRLYADAQSACFSNGEIHYQVRVDKEAGKFVVKEGPFGSEREVEKPLLSNEELRNAPRVRNDVTCKTHLRAELVPPPLSTREIVVLRDGDGYLDLGPERPYLEERRARPRNLTLYQARTGKAIPLPMTWDEDFSPSETTYSEFRNAYVLRPREPRGAPLGVSGPWPKDQPLVVYLLFPDGRVESVSIPYWPSEYLTHPRPVKSGWIFGGGNFYKASGLHLFDGKVVSKFDIGLVKEIAVSPDGCKAAVAIQNKHLDMGTPTNLRVFDFCRGVK
jgi:hypothetical protein